MNTLIIEDEQIAAQNLRRMLADVDPDIKVTGVLQSVEESVEHFSHDNDTELVFMDIHLADGLAFGIFEQVNIECPIIFTTAYDQYALDAFKVNSIDYLLKPIDREALHRAVDKLRRLEGQRVSDDSIASMMAMMRQQNKKYKSYFLIPVRDKLVPLDLSRVAYFYLNDKTTHAVEYDGSEHTFDRPLDSIMEQLNPDSFFRANRQYIVAHSAIDGISVWPLSKLHISLSVPTPEKIIVSRARASEFKEWYTN